jgi:hypothetical protein
MKFKNLHQPFIFKKNETYNMLVSEILDEKFEFIYGGGNMKEEMWKLKYVDENFNVTNINTPSSFDFFGETIHVIAECSGFISDNKISYIIGGHNKQPESSYSFFLINGDFNFENKTVENFKIIAEGVRAAFIDGDKIYAFNQYNGNIYLNGELLCGTDNILNTVIRIMGICDNENEIILTGLNDTYESHVLNVKTLEFKKIKTNNNNSVIYKSSIIGDTTNGILVYTDKVFMDTKDNEYYLNYEEGYILE